MVHNLPGLVRAGGRGAWEAVAAALPPLVRRLDADGQCAVAEAFGTLAREKLLSEADLCEAVLPLALAGAGDGSAAASDATQQAWLACLSEVAAALDPATLHSALVPAVAQRIGATGLGVRDRCLSCQLLGVVAPLAAADDLQPRLLRLGSALCQDTEWQVRYAACRHAVVPTLLAIAAAAAAACQVGVGAAPVPAAVAGDLLGLLEDEEVRHSAAQL